MKMWEAMGNKNGNYDSVPLHTILSWQPSFNTNNVTYIEIFVFLPVWQDVKLVHVTLV